MKSYGWALIQYGWCPYKKRPQAKHQWLTSVILIIQEADIRRIVAGNQHRQIVCEMLSWKNPSQKSVGGVAQGVDPKFKLQYHKKKKTPKVHT
jgi:hypothetical protein